MVFHRLILSVTLALWVSADQYAGAQPSYRDNGDGTVSDLVTGLMWMQDPGEKMTFDEASENAKKCAVIQKSATPRTFRTDEARRAT